MLRNRNSDAFAQHTDFSRIPKFFPSICAGSPYKKKKSGQVVAFLQQKNGKRASKTAGNFFEDEIGLFFSSPK